MRIKGAIFDLDGTLLNSMFIWDTIGEDYLRSLGITPRAGLNETLKNMSLYQAACHYQKEYGVAATTDEIMCGVNGMIEHYYQHEVCVKEGVLEFLARLQQRGIKMCIATATDRHLVCAALKRNKISDYFAEIFTCTSVGHGKDEPDIYEAALRFLATQKAETFIFEDALYAARTARTAGFPVVGVFDPGEKKSDELRAISDFYLDTFMGAKEVLE